MRKTWLSRYFRRGEALTPLNPGTAGWRAGLAVRTVVPVCLLVILLAGALFRFTGLNWDDDQHLHPDERFMTMVANDTEWPADLTWRQYFDTATSPLNPYNHNFGFYVYGTLPLFLVKRVAIWLSLTEFNQLTLVGRSLSALIDLGAICLLFLMGRRLYGVRVALLGAALLAMTVLSIQQAHFFTVDTFANFFVVATLYFAVRASQLGSWSDYALLGLALGAGMASKVSLFTLGGVAALAAGIHFYHLRRDGTDLFHAIEQIVVRLVLAAFLSVLAFRVLQPIAFQGPSFFNFTLNEQWLANMREVSETIHGNRDLPPGHQWTNRAPLWFPWKNMVVWGMGLPLGLAAWVGFILATYELFRKQKLSHLLPVTYVGLVFLHQGTQWVKSLRYFLPIYPFLALLAGYLLIWVWDWAVRRQPSLRINVTATGLYSVWDRLKPRHLAISLLVLVLGGTLLYAIAFTSIYRRPHTRIQASEWIYEHIPAGTVLAVEHWDDGLPRNLNNLSSDRYQYVTLTTYDEDTPQKLAQLVERLSQAEVVILSSNRLYDSIPRLPLRYPMTTRYYELLLAEKLGFEQSAEFTSYPQLFGLELPDQGAEEAFTVYDHPKVTILQKTADFDADEVQHLLGDGIDWDGIIRSWPKQATAAPTGLMFSPLDWQQYSEAGTWSTLFDPMAWTNQFPVITWLLVLIVVGLLAWPLTFVIFNHFVDRGYVLSKAMGLLWIAWIAWLIASNHLLPFGPSAIGVGVTSLALVSALAAWAQRQDLIAFLRTRWRLILCEETLFWGLFFCMLWIRWRNPDLWHPDRGGEKPMDFAYLNAVVRSIYFPPYDPWFAGGFINYYYFGFVLVATLIKLTGVVPAVAYNLAVPTFFAMTALGSFSVALNLATRTHRAVSPIITGLLAILFVTLIGNLGQARVLGQAIQDLSSVEFDTQVPGLLATARTLDGLSELIRAGFDASARPEKWYWDASRLIPHPATEAGPITEFPFFSFLFADLHAHLMALPYTLLVLALAINLIRVWRHPQPGMPPIHKDEEDEVTVEAVFLPAAHAEGGLSTISPSPGNDGWHWSSVRDRLPIQVMTKIAAHLSAINWREVLTLSLLALAVGILWPLNTWDFPTYTVVVGLALACREFGRRQRVSLDVLWAVTWRWGVILGLGFVFFWPFHQNYAAAHIGVERWQGSLTPLDSYLALHGFFLLLIVTYVLLELRQGQGHNAVARLLRPALRRWSRLGRFRHLYRMLVRPLPTFILALRLGGLGLLAILALLGLGYSAIALIVVLMLLVALVGFSTQVDPQRQFILGLIGLGLTLTLGVELFVLKGDISRMNTVFKFYMQVWIVWGIAAAVCLPLIAIHLHRWGKVQRLWWLSFALLFMTCLLYPLTAIPARIQDRFATSVGKTLDGTAYMVQAVYRDRDQYIPLDWDRQALAWLQANVYGSPVIVEANTPLYRWGNRVAVNTGLPALIGWDWHEKQQRAVLPADVIDRRLRDVQTIYTEPDPKTVYDLLYRYGVQYVYVGPVEQIYYGSEGLHKFEVAQEGYWNLVYENEGVKIYQVLYKNR